MADSQEPRSVAEAELISAREPAPAPPVAVPGGGHGRRLPALVEAMRPRQWLKNLLVLAAPGAAGVLLDAAVAGRVALAFGAFCMVASGGYLINDVWDARADRRHPRKRHRPVAEGRLSPRVAAAAAVELMVGGLVLGALVAWQLLAALAAYVA